MKISYIHTTDLSTRSTSANFIVYNSLGLSRYCDVDLYLLNSSAKPPEEILREQYGIESIPGTLRIRTKRFQGISRILFYSWVVSQLRQAKPDVVITRSHSFLPYVFRSKKNSSKVFFETHDYFLDLTLRSEQVRSQWRKKSKIERKYFKRLDGLLCLNQIQKELYQRAFPQQSIDVFPTGLTPVEGKAIDRRSGIVYAGSLNSRLGTRILVDLAAQLEKCSFTIIGGKTEKEKNEFEKLFTGQQLPDNVEITGWLNKAEVFERIAASRVALLPLEDTYFNKNLTVPLKLLDYIACGTPVIASNYDSVKEFLEDGKHGSLVDWEDKITVINKISSLLTDHKSWDSVSSNLQQLAKSLTWDQRSKQLFNYLSEI